MKQQFTIGQNVYDKRIKKAGKVVNVSKDNELYLIEYNNGKLSAWSSSDSLLLLVKPNVENVFDRTTNIPIRSIKSLIKKSKVSPSDNLAEEKAIDFFVRCVHTMGDSYIGDSEYYADEDCLKEFKDQLTIIEKMAIEFYKKMRL